MRHVLTIPLCTMLSAFTSLLLVAGEAGEKKPPRPDPERMEKEMAERFAKADTNNDGKLDKAEFTAHLIKVMEDMRNHRGGPRQGEKPKNRDEKEDGDKPEGDAKDREAARQKLIDDAFTRTDTNADGAVDLAEFKVGAKRMMEMMRERRQRREGRPSATGAAERQREDGGERQGKPPVPPKPTEGAKDL